MVELASMTTREAQSELLKIAAEMVRGEGLPSPYAEDHNWYRTTPVAERIAVERQYEKASNRCKEWAMRLKKVADSLSLAQQRSEQP